MPEDEDSNSLESTSVDSDASEPDRSDDGGKQEPKEEKKKEKLNARVQNLITRVNIYLLLFIMIIVLAVGVVFISMKRSQNEAAQDTIDSRELTPEELEEIKDSDATVGDPKQTLTIESNAIFSGTVLVRDSLDVAGEIKVGGTLNLPGITVSGTSALNEVAANQLSVAGDTSVQGQLNVQQNLAVSGSATFGGPISAPQITIGSLEINNDLSFNRHLDAGGGTPGRVNGSALGSGGTTSISGTDTAGTLRVNTGSGPSAGCFATINFRNAFTGAPHIVITPVGSAGASVRYYINRTNSSFSICSANTPPSGASFSFDWIAID